MMGVLSPGSQNNVKLLAGACTTFTQGIPAAGMTLCTFVSLSLC